MKQLSKLKYFSNDQSGQSLIEFLVFLPFLLIFYGAMIIISSSINGSINQQKIVRSYYFYLLQNDSYMLASDVLQTFRGEGIRNAGIYAFGWKDYELNKSPVAPCYKLPQFSIETNKELCNPETKSTAAITTSQFIRVKSAFGLCAANYSIDNNSGNYILAMNSPSLIPIASFSSCLNLK